MSREMSTEELSSRKSNITNLVTTYYYNNEFLEKKRIKLDDLINSAIKIYLYSDLSMEEIEQDIITRIYKLKNELADDFGTGISDENSNNSSNNVDKTESKLKGLLNDLNEANIDYRITGLSAFTLASDKKVPSDNLSIYINDNDMDKFIQICKKNGFKFIDRRKNPNRTMKNGNIVGDPNISAESEDGLTNVDAQDFERLSDNSVITKDNYINSDGTHCIKADFYGKDLAKEIFDTDRVSVNGGSYPIVAPEFSYIASLSASEKQDNKIAAKYESQIDSDRIKKIQDLAANGFMSQITKGEDVSNKQNDDLEAMMTNNEPTLSTNEITQQKEKPKQFVKSTSNNNQGATGNNGGYVSKLAFIFFLLLVIVLFLLGILLLNM